jgi:Ca-activated chloride channel family protein
MSRQLLRIFAFGFLCVLLSAAGAARQVSFTITGSVVDASLSPLAGVIVTLERDARTVGTATTDRDGRFTFADLGVGVYRVRATAAGLPPLSREVRITGRLARTHVPLVLAPAADAVVAGPPPTTEAVAPGAAGGRVGGRPMAAPVPAPSPVEAPQMISSALPREWQPEPVEGSPWASRERYAHVEPNRFHSAREQPLSTFGADVDTASYANVRRFLSLGQRPPRDAVRVEEMVNYFRFDYDEPRDGRPIAITTEIGDCPWAPAHKLVLIGARARTTPASDADGRNIVLLVDVSGSMAPADKLPLLKQAFAQFAATLRPDDRLAIVTYAGWSGVALASTPGRDRETIQRAIARLNAGGSTNGASGLVLAYRLAREGYIPGGVNRVILATDGDFNVGVTSTRDLVDLIQQERDSGIFLSIFGVGTGNLNDAMMERLADRGNGHYAYLDSLQEARRVLIREGDGTLETVAKDVKFQVEFNPAAVGAWKLLGYENRALASQDFNDDRKDAGEVGAGHTVTVLYEVIPAGSAGDADLETLGRPAVDPLRYQTESAPAPIAALVSRPDPHPGEWLTVKVRYKAPEDDRSDLIVQPVRAAGPVRHLPLAAALAEFGLLLRDGSRGDARWEALSRRVAALEVPRALVTDKDRLAELVAIAAGLTSPR